MAIRFRVRAVITTSIPLQIVWGLGDEKAHGRWPGGAFPSSSQYYIRWWGKMQGKVFSPTGI